MQNRKGFTLVELIVVITILAILGTIAFISLQGYSSESRDSKRISDLGQIRTGLQIEQAREGEVPMPENAVSIGTGSTVLLYQGYAGTGTLNELRVSEAKDPVEDIHYTYTTNSNRTKFQLVAMLENEEISYNTNSIIPRTYSDYENRIPFVIGDPLGILLDSTNTPIQELSFPDNEVDLSGGEEYTLVTTREDTITSSGAELVAAIEESSNNTGGTPDTGDTSESEPVLSDPYESTITYGSGSTFSYDGENWYVSSNTNVAYTKEDSNNLDANDNILVFDNGQSLIKNDNAFILKTVNAGASEVWTGQTFDDVNSSGSWSDYSDTDKSDNWPKSWAGGLYVWGNNTDFSSGQVGNNKPDPGFTGDEWTLGDSSTDNPENLCGVGYRIPSGEENTGDWAKIIGLVSINNGSELQTYLKMSYSGHRYSTGGYNGQDTNSRFWSSVSTSDTYASSIYFYSSNVFSYVSDSRSFARSVRCVKN